MKKIFFFPQVAKCEDVSLEVDCVPCRLEDDSLWGGGDQNHLSEIRAEGVSLAWLQASPAVLCPAPAKPIKTLSCLSAYKSGAEP